MQMKSWCPGITSIFFALMLSLGCATASAQATRTWVSGVGDDANPCSRTAPCKTWAGAISKTTDSGEINCLDPGGFGAVTITKSITILCESGTGGVLVSGTNGFNVIVSDGQTVTLKGLDIDGLGMNGGSLAGVKMSGGGRLTILDCNIYGFQGQAGPPSSGYGVGVFVNGASGAHVLIENTIIRNNLVGVYLVPQTGVLNTMIIERTVIESNPTANLGVATGGTVQLSQSTLAGGPTAILYNGGGSVISFGNNVIRNAGLPTSTVALQ
jgi:Right handed beta helix region